MNAKTALGIAALAVLTAFHVAPATAGRSASDPTHPAWLVGDWGESETAGGRVECGDETLLLDPSGYFNVVSTSGIWSYRNGRLCTRGFLEYDKGVNGYAPGALTCQSVRRTRTGYQTRYGRGWRRDERCGGVQPNPSLAREVAAARRRWLRGDR